MRDEDEDEEGDEGAESPTVERPFLDFKGLMAPVFTSFKDDNQRSVRVDNIDKYAKFLSNRGVKGVLVNGRVGEGPALGLEEKKKVAEKWAFTGAIYSLARMIQVGGAPLPDVLELTRFTESLGVDSILCLPDLFYKPKTEEALVKYLKMVADRCPDTALLYYHIPKLVGSHLNMSKVYDLADVAFRNFSGIVCATNDLDMAFACLKEGRKIFLETDTLLSSALMLGFDAAIVTTLNIYPELPHRIWDNMKRGRMHKVQQDQSTLNTQIKRILDAGNGKWVPSMKKAFDFVQQPEEIFAGPVRWTFD